MKNLELDKDSVYILGVSGGPDSMALFDMCRKQNIQVIAAHMNYQLRDSAKRDMEIVQAYSKRYGITCVVRMQNKQCIGNFQAFARTERYAFYYELLEKYQAKAVLLAHQMDDHIETYLMQKQSQRDATYYGIKTVINVLKCPIVRPLLSYTKQQLETYCKENHVPYGIDESNLTNHYTRNRIRHEQIDLMSIDEKNALVQRIHRENENWQDLCEQASSFLSTWNREVNALRHLEDEVLDQVIIQFVMKECGLHLPRSEMAIVHALIIGQSKQWTRDIATLYVMYSEYGKLCIDTKADVAYTYTYHHLIYDATPQYTICFCGTRTEALTLCREDFPITIRTYQEGDEIQLRFGTKRVNRWFIDRKIPKKERRRWPVVVNASGNVIFVPQIGCDIAHFSNNPTCFVVK